MNTPSNFTFLKKEDPILFNIAQSAEFNLHTDPVTSLFKARQFGEKMTEVLFFEHYLDPPHKDDFHNRLRKLDEEGLLPWNIKNLFFGIKSKGNIAVHQNKGTFLDAQTILKSCFKVGVWFYQTYSEDNFDISHLRFVSPQKEDVKEELTELEAKYKALEAEFLKLQEERKTQTEGLSEEKTTKIKQRSTQSARKIDMSEAETRIYIDEQLRLAKWEVSTEILNYKKHKTLPERGKNRAIAEWKVAGGYVDYALFIGLELYGFVEAKKYRSDISSDLSQAKRYAKNVTKRLPVQLLGDWREYRVPFLFSTNGRPYLKQIETKSGIWFLDVRNPYHHAKCLQGWYSPEGLKKLWEQNLEEANNTLQNTPSNYLTAQNGLSLRPYQMKAIKAIEEQLIHHPNKKRALLAMATGTGKTRTIIGLCYRLIKSNRFKRILFMVDRRLLASQAFNSFKDNRIEDINTFAEIYKVTGLKETMPELETRLHFATVQSMVKRLLYAEENVVSIDTYDCIIVDEAHRGYLLDKELDEEELNFKNQNDYVSKYRQVLEYFDAYAIGLTATPALHTTEIFGKPVFTYSYREAVIDGFLVDHDPPYKIKTKLSEEGMLWAAGERPKAYDKEQNTIVELAELEDELLIEVTQFNKLVITKSFNQTVIKELVKLLDPESEEKTLIFTVNNAHADLVVSILKEEFKTSGALLTDDAIQKITGSIDKPDEWVRRYKNEQFPNIVVTVDLLTTGVDVPPITNLVFLRRVSSRILYEQMLGRATRLCPEIGKEVFYIFDAVRLYEGLKPYTQMKPVTVNPQTTFAQLVGELEQIESSERSRKQVEQIIAKFQRKKGYINESNEANFEYHTKGQSVDGFIAMLREISEGAEEETLKQYRGVWKFLDDLRPSPAVQLVSEHQDEYLGMERGYGAGEKPEDYLLGFEQFIRENQNKIAALNLICTRPALLDRASLKELKLILDEAGYNVRALNTAWKSAKNEEIAADIIAYIRTLALGNALVGHEERIQNAMKKVRALRSNWTKRQSNWIDRFEAQLLQESILQKEDLDKEPFKRSGGFVRLNKVFEEGLEGILEVLNEELYRVA